MKIIKVIGAILFMPIAFLIGVGVWVVMFFPMTFGLAIQAYEKIVFNKPIGSEKKKDIRKITDEEMGDLISKAFKTNNESNEKKENDKDKGGK